jgi:hypothetical protein
MYTHYILARDFGPASFQRMRNGRQRRTHCALGAADGGYIPLDDPYRVRGSEKLWGERDQAVMMEFMLRTGYNAHKCKMGAK